MQRKRSRKLAEDNVFGGKKTLENPQKQKSKSEIGKPLESKNCPLSDQMKCRGKEAENSQKTTCLGEKKTPENPQKQKSNSGIGKPLESKICPLSDQMKFEGKELENSQKKVDNPYNMFGRK